MPTAAAHDAEVGRCVRQMALAIARSRPGARVVQFGYHRRCAASPRRTTEVSAASSSAAASKEHDGVVGRAPRRREITTPGRRVKVRV